MDLKATDSPRTILDSDSGMKLRNVPTNQLNKSSRKVGIKNPKQKVAVALKYKGFGKTI